MKRRFNKQQKLHIRKNDMVKVLSGNHRGKTGKVLEIFPEKNRAIVESVNIVTKHIKPSASHPEGGIEKSEAALRISNLMLIDPATGDPTRTGRKREENGKLKRYSKKTGELTK